MSSPTGPKGGHLSHLPYERLSDAELVRTIANGQSDAVGVVWDRYADLVRTVLRANLGPDHALDDLLQEVFIVFLRSAADLRDPAALRGFLVGVAVRLVSVEIRQRRTRRVVAVSPTGEVPDYPTPPRDTESMEALRALYRILEGMPPRRRFCFVLRQVQGCEVGEAATILNISESTVKREVDRARETILARARGEPALWQFLQQLAQGTSG